MKVYPSLTINASSEPTVSQGSRGNAVVQLQEALANAGFSPGAADGDFGPGTRAALVRFQAAHGLSQDGVAGPNTWRALASANNGASAPAPSAPAPSSGEPTLADGASGSAVSTLQQDLTRDGFSTGGVDGVFGRNTLNAVESFQRSRGLSVDGVVGQQTWKALNGAGPAPSAPSSPAPTTGSEPTIYQGSSGAAVKTLQQMLTSAGYSTDGVDGSFGANTRNALVNFQRTHGLADDGICGPATWAALESHAPATSAPISGGSANGTSANLVAQQYLGDAEHSLEFSGQLNMDTWVPTSEDCANFVSGCLQKAGLISSGQHSDAVTGLRNNLLNAGWTETFSGSPTNVPLADAKPGDVVCFDGPGGAFQHVEIFNGFVNGKPQYIGSNNILSDGTQEISTDTGSWAYTVHVYSPPA